MTIPKDFLHTVVLMTQLTSPEAGENMQTFWSMCEYSIIQNLGKAGLQKSSIISTWGKEVLPLKHLRFQMKPPAWLDQISIWGMDAPWQERSAALTPQRIRGFLLHWIQQELGLEMYWGTLEWVNSESRFKARAQHKCARLFKLKLLITLLFPCIRFFPGRWQEIAGRLWFFLQWKATINHAFFWPCSYRETEWIWAIFSDSTGCSDSVFGAASSLSASVLYKIRTLFYKIVLAFPLSHMPENRDAIALNSVKKREEKGKKKKKNQSTAELII